MSLDSTGMATTVHVTIPQLREMGPMSTPGPNRLVMEGVFLCQLHTNLSHASAASRADSVLIVPLMAAYLIRIWPLILISYKRALVAWATGSWGSVPLLH